MTLRKSAPHQKPRWLALLIVLTLALGLVATTALANHVTAANAPNFSFVNDQDGADDEPGQKDLNAHANATNSFGFWTAVKWDVTGLKGNNSADACFLFDTNSNDLVDAAACVTVKKTPAEFNSLVIYTCGDTRDDRCTNPEVVSAGTDGYHTECFITNPVSDPFHGNTSDTQATCYIDLTEIDATTPPTLINTCSYPSREPNSDPSDCIVTIGSSITTLSSGSAVWTATLNDTATLSPSNATGTVTFQLFSDADCATTPVFTSSAIQVSGGTASTSTTITNVTVDGDGIYYWIATYTPTAGSAFTGSASVCGETTTITPADVDGAAG